ncbi:MAG: response regulator [Oscillatoriaceae cyanobacterium]
MPKILDSPWDDTSHPVILIVEDSDEDFYAFLRATQNLEFVQQLPYHFLRFQDGDETLNYLFREEEYAGLDAPLPVFMLVDLNLPGTDGREIIQQVKRNPALQIIPIIVFTTSNNARDVQTCYSYGVNSYLLKPMGAAKMQQTIQQLFQYWFNFTILPNHVSFSF